MKHIKLAGCVKSAIVGLCSLAILGGAPTVSFADTPSSMRTKSSYSRNARLADATPQFDRRYAKKSHRRIATKRRGDALSSTQNWMLAVLQAKKANDAAGKTFQNNEQRLAALPKVPRKIERDHRPTVIKKKKPDDSAKRRSLKNEVRSLLHTRVSKLGAERKRLSKRLRNANLSDTTRKRLEKRYTKICSRQYALRVQLHRVKNGSIDKRRLNKLYAKLGGKVSRS